MWIVAIFTLKLCFTPAGKMSELKYNIVKYLTRTLLHFIIMILPHMLETVGVYFGEILLKGHLDDFEP